MLQMTATFSALARPGTQSSFMALRSSPSSTCPAQSRNSADWLAGGLMIIAPPSAIPPPGTVAESTSSCIRIRAPLCRPSPVAHAIIPRWPSQSALVMIWTPRTPGGVGRLRMVPARTAQRPMVAFKALAAPKWRRSPYLGNTCKLAAVTRGTTILIRHGRRCAPDAVGSSFIDGSPPEELRALRKPAMTSWILARWSALSASAPHSGSSSQRHHLYKR